MVAESKTLQPTRRTARQVARATTPIPIELVERLVGPVGLATMITAQVRGASFKPIATLVTRAGRFVAEIDFVAPLGAERQTGVIVMLGVNPRRG